jgi:protoporphyrinogen oxidase
MRTVILGAGITGLAAGIKTGGDIYEAKDVPGGLCRSVNEDGFTYEEHGGHWMFGADKRVQKFVGKYCSLKKHTRNAGVYINNHYPYPIQATPFEPGKRGTMKRWLSDTFDKSLCSTFLHPFNEKYTAGVYASAAQSNPAKSPAKGKGYNEVFYYPPGGWNRLVEGMADDNNIYYNKTAVHIAKKTVYFSDNTVARFDRLISTIPLSTLLTITEDAPTAGGLMNTSVAVLNVYGSAGERVPKWNWLYVLDKNASFYRIGFYNNVEPKSAPKGSVCMYIESAFFDNHVTPLYEPQVENKLVEYGYVPWSEYGITFSWIPCAYTWELPGTKVDR